MKRSSFILGAASGLTLIAKSGTFFSQALAADVVNGAAPDVNDRVLVLVNMQGGNDGLNTIVPYASREYYDYRPKLSIPATSVLTINDSIGFNPALAALKPMYDRGALALVQGVGYPDPNHSHFRSTEIWQTAQPERFERTGWLGRYLDTTRTAPQSLFCAAALADVLPEVLIADHVDVPAIASLRGYGLRSDRNRDQRSALSAFSRDERLPFTSPFLARVSELEGDAQRGSEQLPGLIAGYTTQTRYPNTPIGQSLELAAKMIGSRIGTKIIYVQHGSFDTHTQQRGTQDRLLTQLAEALSAFYADLAAHGNAQRVLTMTFSEFGRRVAENASGGTDHGEAAPLFLLGPVRGGVYGDHPSLTNLSNGNLGYTVDFRSVYATVIERWLGREASPIIGGSYRTMDFVS